MMFNQHLKILASQVLLEQVQYIQIIEQRLNQQEIYLISNVIQQSEISYIKQQIEKLAIEYQSLLIQKYLKEAITQFLLKLDYISLQQSFESQPDDLKCYISTIKYLSSFITNIPSFFKFMEELNICLQHYNSIDCTKTVAKRAYKLMKFQELLCYYMDQFQKQRGIDLNKYYNIQRNMQRYKNLGKIKFDFKKQQQKPSFSKIPIQSMLSTSQSNSYSVTPQPKILGYTDSYEQSQISSTINQQNNCSSLISQVSQLQINPQVNNFSQQQQNSLIYVQQVQNQQIYGLSAIQQPIIYENSSNYNYPPMPQSYYGFKTQTFQQQPQEQYSIHKQLQILPQNQYTYQQQQSQQQQQQQQQQLQQQQQQQQIQQFQYQQSQQQYQQEQLKSQQQYQNYLDQQFKQEQNQIQQNQISFQEDSVQQQVITDSVFQKSLSEISEVQNMTLQQFGFDNSIQPEKIQLDDASFQEQINQKEENQNQQINQGNQNLLILEQSEFEELVINKAKTTQILLDPQTNQQVYSIKQSQFIFDKSNQNDFESIKLLERFLERKQSQYEREDQRKQILQLFDI